MSIKQVRPLSRRGVLRAGLGVLVAGAALPLLASCGSQAAPTAAPAKPTEAPKPASAAPTTAATKPAAAAQPAEPTKPAAAAAAATKPADAAKPAAAAAAGGKSYKITFAHDWNSGVRGDMIKFLFQEFKTVAPNITVEPLAMGSGAGTSSQGGLFETVVAQFVAGQAPDVIFGWPEMVPLWNRYLADLTTHWKDRKADDLGIFDSPETTTFEGKRMAVSFAPNVTGWYVNTTMIKKAGLAVPGDEWDWNQQLDLMKKLTTPDGKQWGGWITNVWDVSYFNYVFANMPGNTPTYWSDPAQTKVSYDAPEALAGFKWAMDLIHTHKVMPNTAAAASMRTGQTNDLFLLGIAAMKPGWLAQNGDVDRFVKDRFEWKILPNPRSPTTNKGHIFGNYEPFAASKDGEKKGNLEPAVDLMLFGAGSDTIQNYVAKRGNRPTIPVKASVLRSPIYAEGPPENMGLIQRLLIEAPYRVNARPAKKYWPEWQAAVIARADKAIIGEQPPEAAWKSVVEATQKIIDTGTA